MKTLTIEARSLESARAIEAALRDFEHELMVEDGRYCVSVAVPAGNQGIVALLNALQEYVQERADGPAHISLGGESYVMEATPSPN
jgi:hypothetical protein